MRHRKAPSIDGHVHFRDEGEEYKMTIDKGMAIAREQEVDVVFDMPNTKDLIISEKDVLKRLELANSYSCLENYYLYIGATNAVSQIKEAARVATTNPKVVGIKYFTTGTNALSIKNKSDQLKLYETLKECDYRGVLCVHCEKDSLIDMGKWDYRKPWSWNEARPPECEVESVKDQIELVKKTGSDLILVIPHTSVPETVDIIDRARNDINIACGVTFHHTHRSTSNMRREEDIVYRVNPSLRSIQQMAEMKQRVFDGKIDWFESDFAPHSRKEKTTPPGISGITESLDKRSNYLHFLRREGLPENIILNMTYLNIKKVFPKVNV